MRKFWSFIPFICLQADDGANVTQGASAVREDEPVLTNAEVVLPAPEVSVEVTPVVEPVVTNAPVPGGVQVECCGVVEPAVVKVKRAFKAKLKAGTKGKRGRPKGSKNKVTVAKVEKSEGTGRTGRPRQYTGAQEVAIAKLIRKFGQTGAMKILRANNGSKLAEFRSARLFPKKSTICLPTLIRISKENGIEVKHGRPAKKVARKRAA